MNKNATLLLTLFAVFVCTYTTAAFSDERALIVSQEGTVDIRIAGTGNFSPASTNQSLNNGDVIRTGLDGRAAMQLIGGGVIRLSPNSFFTLETTGDTPTANLSSGKAFFFSREAKRFPVIKTPAVSAAVRGTEFTVEVIGNLSTVSVLDGAVKVSNKKGEVSLGANEIAKAKPGQAPEKSILLNPIDAVQWAIYVPKIEAGNDLRKIKNATQSSQLMRISKDLSSGKMTIATQSLINFEKQKSSDPTAVAISGAYRALIELSKNNIKAAKESSTKALSADDKSETANIVASFVAQAEFKLEESQSYALAATKLNPSNQSAALRLAEVNLSLGDVKAATQLLNSLSPSARRNTLLGFAKLISYETPAARDLFTESVKLDPSSALSQLGLGLAVINEGDLAVGRNHLEIAAALEPNVAIYRSYLGKAFFEENRETLAGHEYDRAISLDPRDPTPYLYRAYNRLSANDPVGALSDVEDSIERNNFRAVYRSSLLLDKDTAVRSAGLAEVFTALGFNRAAQLEAIKSINQDYGNFSAHRLLSDSYNTILTTDALVSEQTIARAYSPLSFNLLGGPENSASINDYNSLFERREIRKRLGFKAGTAEDLIAPSASLTGRTERLGYLLGVESANFNGSKDNDYLRDNRFRGALQYQLNSDTRLFTEAKYQARHGVDHNAGLDNILFENHEIAAGFNSKFAPETTIVGQVTYRDSRQHQYGTFERSSFLDIISGGEINSYEDVLLLRELARSDVRDTRISAQVLHNTKLLSVVAGGEAYFARPRRLEDSPIIDDQFDLFSGIDRRFKTQTNQNIDSQDLYLYPTLHVSDYLDINGGITYTNLELEAQEVPPFVDTSFNRSQWNPKLGATAYVTPSLTLKTAYFEGLRKSALEDTGTLEPTLVGGFNQVYTDFSGTRSRTYGVGFDYKLSKRTYFGAEANHRDTIEDANFSDSLITLDLDNGGLSTTSSIAERAELFYNQEYLTGYLYHVLTSRWVTTLDYNYFMSELTDPEVSQDISLHKARGALRYFDPQGWFAFAELTFRQQDREGSFFVEDGSNDFWITDIGAGYRFPNRQGSITLRCNNLFDKDFIYDQSVGFEEFVVDNTYGEIVLSFNF